MPAFYLTLVAVLLAGIGARDSATVAGLARRQGRRPGVLFVALLSSLLTAASAAWAATLMLADLPPPARAIFGAIALGMAGLESLVMSPRTDPREPTRSLGALLLVLLVQQVADAARFLVFGLAVGLAGPIPAGAAGALGGCLLVSFAWLRPDLLATRAAALSRRMVGAVLLLAGGGTFLAETGIL